MKVYLLILGCVFSSLINATELIEHHCNVMVKDNKTKESGEMEIEDFRMLDYNETVQFKGFTPFDDFTVTSIVCDRSSIVPAKFDYVALSEGYPLYIRDSDCYS